MKKDSTGRKVAKPVQGERKQTELELPIGGCLAAASGLTVGLDLGDRASNYCVLDEKAEVVARGAVSTDRAALQEVFGKLPPSGVALEVGTHSPWVSRLLEELGHEVIVANARQVQLITRSSRKNDRRDAEFLARLARADRKLLAPVRHRGAEAQADLMGVRVRAQLVELRTQAINAARGFAKSYGMRLAKCDADNLERKHAAALPTPVRDHIEHLLKMVEELTREIAACDEELEKLERRRYGTETARLKQVSGVGTITALTFVLTLEDPHRFQRSREVGCYVGLRPQSKQSGDSEPEMRVSKEGDVYLRNLLVECGQYILSQRGPDTDLKRWGLRIAAKGKKKAKRRAVVAVARKLAVLLHRLWVSGERYEPHRSSATRQKAAA